MQKSWAVLWTVFLASIAVVYNQFKVTPAMNELLAELSLDLVTGGWLMSIFAVAGVVLAFPAAGLFVALGPRQSGLLSLGAAVLGSLLGSLAQTPGQLLLGRSIEGISVGLMAVIAPAVIALWFEPDRRGLPMGIWSAWVPTGGFLALTVGSLIINLSGWRSLWWSGTFFAVAAMLVWALVIARPSGAGGAAGGKRAGSKPLTAIFKAPGIWLLCLGFVCYNFIAVGFGTWGPSYYQATFGLDGSRASFYCSLFYLFSIPAAFAAGRVLNSTGKAQVVLPVAIALAGLVASRTFLLSSVQQIFPFVVLLAATTAFYPPSIFTLAPETVPGPEYLGVAMGIVNIGSSLGTLLGPPVLGQVVETARNWSAGTYPLIMAALVAVTVSCLFMRLHKANR